MCGIYGILGIEGPARTDPAVLERMGNAIRHRGPDDSGAYSDDRIRLGMRRLSIIDVSGGHQPIASEDGNVVVVCNGEIYNFQALRRELEIVGHRFSSHSDTECIVHLYEQEGDAFLNRLEGMFGLALWDKRRRRLILARDALGIKPLYYGTVGSELVFASEAKAMLSMPGFQCEVDRSSLTQFLAVGYVSAPNSMFVGLNKLAPGSALFVENGSMEIRRFWRLDPGIVETRSEREWTDDIRSEMERSVREQMISDVPIGAFLSGGLDSSSIVALMSRNSDQPVRTYSIGFSGSSGAALYNELPFARTVAEACGTQHREIVVQPDVAALLPHLIWHLDEPIADAAFITTFLVSKFAREDVTVILSGVGGDELFGGYRRYLDEHYRGMYRRVPRLLRRGLIEPVAKWLPSDRHGRMLNELRLLKAFVQADSLEFSDRYRRYMEVFTAEQRNALISGAPGVFNDRIAEAFAVARSGDALRQLMEVDLATQMPEDLLMLTDKMSMAASLECRVPLLDQRLVQLAAQMPGNLKIRNGELKYAMKRAMRGVVPDSILNREKRGFGAPIGAWFKNELAPLLRHILSRESVQRRGLLNFNAVEQMIREHERSHADRTDHLLSLLVLEIWCRLYLDGESPAAVTDEIKRSMAA